MAEQEDKTPKPNYEYRYRSQKLIFTPATEALPPPVNPRTIPQKKAKRTQTREKFHQIMKAIKQHNLDSEHVGFKKLCTFMEPHLVSQFIREAESWGMIESKPGEKHKLYVGYTVTSVGEAFISYCKRKEKKV